MFIPDILAQRMNSIKSIPSGKPVIMINFDRDNTDSLSASTISQAKKLFTIDEIKSEKFNQKNLMEPFEFIKQLEQYMEEEVAMIKSISTKITPEDKKNAQNMKEFYLKRAEGYFETMMGFIVKKITQIKEMYTAKIIEILSINDNEQLEKLCIFHSIKSKEWGEMTNEQFYNEIDGLVGQVSFGESIHKLFSILKQKEKKNDSDVYGQVVSSLSHRVYYVAEETKKALETLSDSLLKIMEDSASMLNFNLSSADILDKTVIKTGKPGTKPYSLTQLTDKLIGFASGNGKGIHTYNLTTMEAKEKSGPSVHEWCGFLDYDPLKHELFTCGNDGFIKVWDLFSLQLLRKNKMEFGIQSPFFLLCGNLQ